MLRLCSTSPTRAKLLKDSGIEFIQSPCNFDEDSIGSNEAREFVYLATYGKFEDSLNRYGFEIPILVADTVVSVDNKILRKAKNYEDAKKLLKLQSGNRVLIITCMIYKSIHKEMIDVSTTEYLFNEFSESNLKEYLDSNEWQGKAGAIMVEGFAKKYIKEVKGYESTAMGLCIERLKEIIDSKRDNFV